MGKRKAEVGPEPPKRPQSGYGLFFAEKRGDISAALQKEGQASAKIMTESAKRAGELWKALGETKQKAYNEKSDKLKVAHTKEMDAFMAANPDFKKAKKLKRGAEDKGPTRPLGAYAMWIADNRPMLTEKAMKEHSVDKAKAFLMLYKVGKPIYDALPAAEKKKWEEKAEAAKTKFQAEHKAWKENNTENNKENTKGKTGGGKGPKRPLGAYPQWLADNRPMVSERIMKEHGVDKSKAFLMLYKEGKPIYEKLPAAEKKKCEEKAAAAKVQFQAECKQWKENKGSVTANGADEDDEEDEEDEDDEDDEE